MQKNLLKKPIWSPDGGGSGASEAFAAAAKAAGGGTEETPPSTIIKDVEFSADELDDSPPDEVEITSTPKDTTIIEREPKETPKEPAAPPVQPKPAETTTTQKPPARIPQELFDDPDDQKFVKEMSNNALQHFSKKLKDLRDKASQAADAKESFYNHPHGYTLLPEYTDTVSEIQRHRIEENHWRDVLVAIEKGENFRLFEGFDDNGQPVLSTQLYKPTERAKIDVQSALVNLTADIRASTKKAQDIVATFKAGVDSASNVVLNERKKRFAWVAKPELEESTELNIPEYGKGSIKKVKEDFISLYPKSYQKHPLAEACADLFVALQLSIAKGRELEGKVNAAQTSIREQQLVEPVVGRGQGGPTQKPVIGKIEEFDAEDMPV